MGHFQFFVFIEHHLEDSLPLINHLKSLLSHSNLMCYVVLEHLSFVFSLETVSISLAKVLTCSPGICDSSYHFCAKEMWFTVCTVAP